MKMTGDFILCESATKFVALRAIRHRLEECRPDCHHGAGEDAERVSGRVIWAIASPAASPSLRAGFSTTSG